MNAALVIFLKTRNDRTELHSPDQHAANRDASWPFRSAINLPHAFEHQAGVGTAPCSQQVASPLNQATCWCVKPPAALPSSASESSS